MAAQLYAIYSSDTLDVYTGDLHFSKFLYLYSMLLELFNQYI